MGCLPAGASVADIPLAFAYPLAQGKGPLPFLGSAAAGGGQSARDVDKRDGGVADRGLVGGGGGAARAALLLAAAASRTQSASLDTYLLPMLIAN